MRSALPSNVQLNQPGHINSNVKSLGSSRTRFMKAHGLIMLFTYMVFIPTAVLIAFFFKQSWPSKRILGKPFWFATHSAIMMIATLATIAGFALILVYKKGTWISKFEEPEYAHSLIGIITVGFAVFQPLLAFFRCKPDGRLRFIFNYLHGGIGILALTLGIVAIFLALFLDTVNLHHHGEWGILIAWIWWVFLMFVLFGFVECYFDTKLLKSNSLYAYNNYTDNLEVKVEPVPSIHNRKKDLIKGFMLFLHILVVLGLSLVLAVTIGLK